MFIELVDSLRCLVPHEESWLVAASRRMVGRGIADGTLGCPVCRREYPVLDGVAYFGVPAEEPRAAREEPPPVGDDTLRLAALLGLDSPRGIVVLVGEWARLGPSLRELTGVHCLLLDPPGQWGGRDDDGVSVVRAGGVVPLATGSTRGVALAAGSGTTVERTMRGAVRALASGGRLVAPADVPPPKDVAELARDATQWVAERRAAPSAPVTLARARPPR